jgi:Flp pilus assembly protein TadB
MKREDAQTASGLSLPVVVFVVFLILRLSGVISWSWWWVTSPLWIVAAIIVAITILYVAVFTYRYRKYKRN